MKFYLIKKDSREILGVIGGTMLIDNEPHFVFKNLDGKFDTIPVSEDLEIKRVEC